MDVKRRPFRIKEQSPETIAAIVEAYKTESAAVIGKRYGISDQTVLVILRNQGQTIRTKGFRLKGVGKLQGNQLREEIYRLKGSGLSGVEIADQLGCSLSSVYKLCNFRAPHNYHLAALEEVRDTLRKVLDAQQQAGKVSAKLAAQVKAMEWVTSIKLPEFKGVLVDGPVPTE